MSGAIGRGSGGATSPTLKPALNCLASSVDSFCALRRGDSDRVCGYFSVEVLQAHYSGARMRVRRRTVPAIGHSSFGYAGRVEPVCESRIARRYDDTHESVRIDDGLMVVDADGDTEVNVRSTARIERKPHATSIKPAVRLRAVPTCHAAVPALPPTSPGDQTGAEFRFAARALRISSTNRCSRHRVRREDSDPCRC